MLNHDPNGEPWEDWKKLGYDSYETFIESKAGACPPDPKRVAWLRSQGASDAMMAWYTGTRPQDLAGDWPMPKPPPFLADDENDETPHA